MDALIAEGGFAVVYAAHQVALDRKIALKVLKTPAGYDQHAQEEFRRRFAAEAKTIARLKHPAIVDVYDFAVSALPSGHLAPWMALEWVEGETLETWLERRRAGGESPLAARDALELLRPVLQAIALAHNLGIVHRDIKPGNIMVADGAGARTLRVLDFGIAKIMRADEETGTGRTRTGSVPAFSPAYAAPEQVTFSRTGPWTDVHALGLIVTELVTGERPYTDPEAAVHEQVMAATRPTPRSKGREVDAFEAVVARAVALAPSDRWKNAGDFLAALEEANRGLVSSAPSKAGGRRRAVTGAAVAGAALLALLALVGASLARRASRPAGEPPLRSGIVSGTAAPRPERQAPAVPAVERPAVPAAPPPGPLAAPGQAPAVPAPQHAARAKRKIPAPRSLESPRKDLFDDTK